MSSTIGRIIRCLDLTTSPNDGEALAAIRRANTLREKLDVGWAAIIATTSADISTRVCVVVDASALAESHWDNLIYVLRVLRRSPYIDPVEFRRLERIESVWAQHGVLLPDQIQFLVDLLQRSQRFDLIKELRK